MRQFFGILIFVPLAVIVGAFAIGNRTPVALRIWPLPGSVETWASVWVLGLLAVGILVGMAIGWLSGSRWRRRARRAEREAKELEAQLAEQDEKAAAASAAAAAMPPHDRFAPGKSQGALPGASRAVAGDAPAARLARLGD